jgi:HD-GYP domain-containing protein (c-di-GMP phosphodiesterase class II)
VTESADCRLAELAGGLSLCGDLADGFPEGKAVRTAALASEIGLLAHASAEQRRNAYYVTLVRFLGCVGFASEEAWVYGAGDDIAVRSAMALADRAQKLRSFAFAANTIARHAGVLERARALGRLFGNPEAVARHARAQCDTSLSVARAFAIDERELGISALMERWDGGGAPARLSKERIPLSVRLLHVADVLETTWHRSGFEQARRELARRKGRQLDPGLVELALGAGALLHERLERGADWEWFLESEPEPHRSVPERQLLAVAACVGRLSDLKSVFTFGHSANVASLATRIAEAIGVRGADRAALEMAGHLHDLGRMGVENSIWDKPAPWSRLERERAELHSLYTERVLLRTPALARFAPLAASAHERIDGNGYHRRLPAAALDRPMRILAVADVVSALSEQRSHRPARSAERIVAALRGTELRGLDPGVVDAAVELILGKQHDGRRSLGRWPSGLTDREVEVLRHASVAKTNPEIAAILGISTRTVQNHLSNAYEKLGVSSRAGAALFLMEQGILPESYAQ